MKARKIIKRVPSENIYFSGDNLNENVWGLRIIVFNKKTGGICYLKNGSVSFKEKSKERILSNGWKQYKREQLIKYFPFI